MRCGMRVKVSNPNSVYYGRIGTIVESNSYLYTVRFNANWKVDFAITELEKL